MGVTNRRLMTGLSAFMSRHYVGIYKYLEVKYHLCVRVYVFTPP